MKLDPDLCRDILMAIEADPNATGEPFESVEIVLPGRSEREISYHVKLLSEAGLIKCASTRSGNDPEELKRYVPTRLTWEGHKFVDDARDKKLWEKAKSTARENGVPLTFEALKRIAEFFLAQGMKKLTGEN